MPPFGDIRAGLSQHDGRHYMTKLISKFAKDESGATAIEYGLIASLISVALIAASGTLGKNISNTFTKVANNVK
mgnify:CR=1 FL=1